MNTKTGQKLVLFFFLAFLITWTLDAFRISQAISQNLGLSNEAYFSGLLSIISGENLSYRPILLSNLVFGPTIAAFITSFIFDKTEGIKSLLRRIFKKPFSLKWFFVATLIHIALVGTSMLVGFVLSGFQPITYEPLIPFGLSLGFLVYMIIFTGIAEEIGWRGYALPNLQKIYTPYRASIILGIIWGLWHLPMTIYANQANPGVIPFTILGLIAGTAGWSVVVTWFYNNSESLFLTFYLHGFGNFLLTYTILSTNLYMANVFYGFAPWLIVVFLEKKFGKKYLEARLT